MHNYSKTFVVGYKLLIGLLSLLALIILFLAVGADAWRFFSPFLLILSGAYFLLNAAVLCFSSKRALNQNLCPMFEGLLIISYLLQCGTLLFYQQATWPELPFLAGALTYFILPILILVDQILLNRKGTWQVYDPLYWLAPPIAYAAWIILSAEFLPADTLLYPLHFLNINQVGIHSFFLWSVFFMLLTTILGYILFLIDYIVSGRLAKRVVLPHIRVVELSDKDLR